jgi:hypothetical protein
VDDLHSVAEGLGHLGEVIRRRDEQHLAEVEGDLEVVVGEGVVLLWVEDLEEGGRRIALPSSTTGSAAAARRMPSISRPGRAPI